MDIKSSVIVELSKVLETDANYLLGIEAPEEDALKQIGVLVEDWRAFSLFQLYIFKSIFIVIVPFFDIIDMYNKETRNPKWVRRKQSMD